MGTRLVPQVSVIIPVYNAERYLRIAVESAVQQRETGEVLLIDDGSSDNSLAVCEELVANCPKVRLLRHPDGGNHGPAATRNIGIKAAECLYVAFLDADDYYLPGRFERAMGILEADPAVDGVYEAVGTQFDTNDMKSWWEEERSRGQLTTITEAVAPEELLATLCGDGPAKGWFCTCGITVRRSLFERTGLFVSKLRMAEDTALWWKMAAVGRLEAGRLQEAVAIRRLHGKNSIVRNAGEVSQKYGVLARSHVLEWAMQQGLEAEIVRPLIGRHLRDQRKLRIANRRRQRLGFQDLPWLVSMGVRQPMVRSHARYGQYMKEGIYWTSASTRVKRILGLAT